MGNPNPMIIKSGCLLNKSVFIAIVLLTWSYVEGAGRPLEVQTATACLSSEGSVEVKCKKTNEKITIKSVSYAHTPDCTNPAKDNKCVQTSADLSRKAQAECNGQNKCKLEVLSVQQYQSQIQGPEGEQILSVLVNCGVDKKLIESARMNIMQVKYECEEFAFCNEISDSVVDLSIATKGYPLKAVTNPSCGCTFEAEEPDVYILAGYTHCNGTVVFVVEETSLDGQVSSLEYECKDKQREDHVLIGNKQPWKIKLNVDVEKSDEESSYEISWYNVIPQTSARKMGGLVKVECKAGSLWLPYSVKLILMIVLPIGGALLIAAIILYCICKKRRRAAKDWRARHIRLKKAKTRQDDEIIMDEAPLTPIYRSRNSSITSFPRNKDERVDPEGNVDDIGEYAAELKKQNEERRRKELERRQGYQHPSRMAPPPMQHTLPPYRTPPPTRSTLQPSRRSQSIGNLRHSERRYAYADNLDSTPDSKPLAYSKSASQSRASVRSLKRRAPVPSGPPQVPVPVHQTRAAPMYASASFTSTPSINNRLRSRQGSTPVLPSHDPPSSLPYSHSHQRDRENPYSTPYAARSPSNVSSPGFSDVDPAGCSDDEEEMSILRIPVKPKPAVAPKPSRQKYNSPGQRYPPSKPARNITPSEMQDLQREEDSDSEY